MCLWYGPVGWKWAKIGQDIVHVLHSCVRPAERKEIITVLREQAKTGKNRQKQPPHSIHYTTPLPWARALAPS